MASRRLLLSDYLADMSMEDETDGSRVTEFEKLMKQSKVKRLSDQRPEDATARVLRAATCSEMPIFETDSPNQSPRSAESIHGSNPSRPAGIVGGAPGFDAVNLGRFIHEISPVGLVGKNLPGPSGISKERFELSVEEIPHDEGSKQGARSSGLYMHIDASRSAYCLSSSVTESALGSEVAAVSPVSAETDLDNKEDAGIVSDQGSEVYEAEQLRPRDIGPDCRFFNMPSPLDDDEEQYMHIEAEPLIPLIRRRHPVKLPRLPLIDVSAGISRFGNPLRDVVPGERSGVSLIPRAQEVRCFQEKDAEISSHAQEVGCFREKDEENMIKVMYPAATDKIKPYDGIRRRVVGVLEHNVEIIMSHSSSSSSFADTPAVSEATEEILLEGEMTGESEIDAQDGAREQDIAMGQGSGFCSEIMALGSEATDSDLCSQGGAREQYIAMGQASEASDRTEFRSELAAQDGAREQGVHTLWEGEPPKFLPPDVSADQSTSVKTIGALGR